MRCPKCGYISFDHLEECLKCNRNIKATSDALKGTVYNIAPPAFLKFEEPDAVPEENGTIDPSVVVSAEADEELELTDEYLDDDLEILVKDSSEEFNLSDDTEIDGPDISLDDFPDDDEEEDDGEIEIDMGQFEDTDGAESPVAAEEEEDLAVMEDEIDISIPDELSDMSDLEPPSAAEETSIVEDDLTADLAPVEEEIASPATDAPVSEQKAEDDVDVDLNDLDFDLNLDGLDGAKGPVAEQNPVIDLDDIDFSDALDQSPAEPVSGEGSVMDDDLDFELDLGGLSIHKDK